MPKVTTGARALVFIPLEPVPDGGNPEDVEHIAFKSWSVHALAAAQRAAGTVLQAGHTADIAGVAFTIAAARWGAVSWKGFEDEDGQPLELTPDNVEATLEQHPDVYRAVDAGYVIPALEKEREKNASAPSSGGTSPD